MTDQENESLKIKAKKINLLLSDGIITSEIAKEMLKNLINNPGDYVSLNACSDSFRGLTAEQRANQVQKSKVDAASSARMKPPFTVTMKFKTINAKNGIVDLRILSAVIKCVGTKTKKELQDHFFEVVELQWYKRFGFLIYHWISGIRPNISRRLDNMQFKAW